MTESAAVALLVGTIVTAAGLVLLTALFVQWVASAASIDPPSGS